MFLDFSFGLSVLFQFLFFLEFLFAFCWKNTILSYLLLTWQHIWGEVPTDSSRQGYGCQWSLSSELGDTADGQQRYLVKQNLNFWAKESFSVRVMSTHEQLPRETEESLNLTEHNPGQLEQITVLSYFQRIHSTSPTPWFCDLNHPSFYLYKLGLPFLVQIHVSLWIFAQQLLTALETAGGFAGDCAEVWQKLILWSAQLPACLIFSQDAHQGSIQFPMRGYPTGGMPFSCVDPGEMPLST